MRIKYTMSMFMLIFEFIFPILMFPIFYIIKKYISIKDMYMLILTNIITIIMLKGIGLEDIPLIIFKLILPLFPKKYFPIFIILYGISTTYYIKYIFNYNSNFLDMYVSFFWIYIILINIIIYYDLNNKINKYSIT